MNDKIDFTSAILDSLKQIGIELSQNQESEDLVPKAIYEITKQSKKIKKGRKGECQK